MQQLAEDLAALSQPLFGAVQFGGLVKAVDSAADVARRVFDRVDVNHRDHARAVRPLNLGFLAMDGLAGAQNLRHRCLFPADLLPIEAIEFERAAKIIRYRRQCGAPGPRAQPLVR